MMIEKNFNYLFYNRKKIQSEKIIPSNFAYEFFSIFQLINSNSEMQVMNSKTYLIYVPNNNKQKRKDKE